MHAATLARVYFILGLISLGLSYVCADELKESTSLRFAPETASFYTTSLRLQEQWERFASSNAFAKLCSLPMVQETIEEIKGEIEDSDDEDFQKLKDFVTASENKNLIKLVHDAASHEIFSFGDENFGRALGLLNAINRKSSNLQLKAAGEGGANDLEVKKQIIDLVADSLDEMEVPRFVLGFRTTLPSLAKAEIERGRDALNKIAKEQDELRGRVSELNEGNNKFVVVRFDGSQIPWDEAIDEEPELATQIKRIRDKLRDREVRIAFGLYNDYLVLIVTPDAEVTNCFASDNLLYDIPKFQRLRAHADRKIASIGYVSDAFIQEVSNPKADIQQLNLVADTFLPKLGIDKKMANDLRADVKKLVSDIESLVPTPGAVLAFSFLTNSGYEGYQENWSENLALDTSEPLSILNHAGGNPIAVVASNSKLRVGKMLRHWLDRGSFYVQELVLKENFDEQQWDLYVEIRDKLRPILQEYRQVTEDHWDKAFTSGQSAFVVDATLTPKPTWHLFMPPSDEPLPMLELAWVTPLSNRFELEQALEGYQQVQENLVATIKELVQEHQAELTEVLEGPAQVLPAMVQQMQVTKPLEREIEDGTIRYRPTLQQAFVDAAIAPNFGWNSIAFAYSLSPETTERVLQVKELEGPLAQAEGKKLGEATYVDISRLIGVFRPWVAYGLDLAKQHEGAKVADNDIEEIAPQIDTILEIMQCYHRYYSITLEGDNNSLVTHSRSDFRDLE